MLQYMRSLIALLIILIGNNTYSAYDEQVVTYLPSMPWVIAQHQHNYRPYQAIPPAPTGRPYRVFHPSHLQAQRQPVPARPYQVIPSAQTGRPYVVTPPLYHQALATQFIQPASIAGQRLIQPTQPVPTYNPNKYDSETGMTDGHAYAEKNFFTRLTTWIEQGGNLDAPTVSPHARPGETVYEATITQSPSYDLLRRLRILRQYRTLDVATYDKAACYMQTHLYLLLTQPINGFVPLTIDSCRKHILDWFHENPTIQLTFDEQQQLAFNLGLFHASVQQSIQTNIPPLHKTCSQPTTKTSETGRWRRNPYKTCNNPEHSEYKNY